MLRFGYVSDVTHEMFNDHGKLEYLTIETDFKVSGYDKWCLYGNLFFSLGF